MAVKYNSLNEFYSKYLDNTYLVVAECRSLVSKLYQAAWEAWDQHKTFLTSTLSFPHLDVLAWLHDPISASSVQDLVQDSPGILPSRKNQVTPSNPRRGA